MRTTSRPGLDTLGPENDIGALTVTVSLACLRAIAKKSAICLSRTGIWAVTGLVTQTLHLQSGVRVYFVPVITVGRSWEKAFVYVQEGVFHMYCKLYCLQSISAC